MPQQENSFSCIITMHQGHVALSARDSNQFSISANAEAGVKVQFHLLYEELLQRRSGQCKYFEVYMK